MTKNNNFIITGANGFKAVKDDLYFAKGPAFMKADAKKNVVQIADVGQAIDGIEPVGNGDFLVTSWSGYIFTCMPMVKQSFCGIHMNRKRIPRISDMILLKK